jgi:hypothetical protein
LRHALPARCCDRASRWKWSVGNSGASHWR